MARFIFMLTRDDRTIPDAREVYANVAGTGITEVGCKDVGLPREELGALSEDIRARGHTSYLEVVSESEEATLASARAAAELRPDYLIGGTLVEPVQEIIAGAHARFFPYVGSVIGHPCLLRGAIADVVEDARRIESLGVDGINLLAYRHDGDVDELVQEVGSAILIPVIAAGSVDSAQRVRALAERGVWAFTIGTAALERRLVPGAPLAEQLSDVLAAAGDDRTPSRIGGKPRPLRNAGFARISPRSPARREGGGCSSSLCAVSNAGSGPSPPAAGRSAESPAACSSTPTGRELAKACSPTPDGPATGSGVSSVGTTTGWSSARSSRSTGWLGPRTPTFSVAACCPTAYASAMTSGTRPWPAC